jgi:hypothetical protein
VCRVPFFPQRRVSMTAGIGTGCAYRGRRGMRRQLMMIAMGILVSTFATEVAWGQSYSSAGGSPTFAAPEPLELGFTDAANGNLHLEIPFGSFPQRPNGWPLDVKLVYDSGMEWVAACNGSCVWTRNTYAGTYDYGWRFGTSVGGSVWSALYCGRFSPHLCGYTFTDPIGTSRAFYFTATTCPGPNTYAADSSGYLLQPCGDTRTESPRITAPDGTIVYQTPTDSNGNVIY